MKTPYSFSVLRYIHDVMTGEFVNIGVVLYAPEARFLGCLCTSKYKRVSDLFLNFDGSHFRTVTRFIQSQFEEYGKRLATELHLDELPNSVSGFSTKVLPTDDSSLQFSPEGYGVTVNPSDTLEKLYARLVEQYSKKNERVKRTEEDIWRSFRKPFEEKHILGKLTSHQIVGPNYDYDFKYCAKNGRWHIQEPISFDLVEPSSITEKANSWLGRITSLADSGEDFKLNVLLGAPQDESLLSAFSKAQNILNKMPCEHEFIREDEADIFAEKLKKVLEH